MAEYIEREAIEYPYMTMSMWGINSATCKAYNEGVKAVEDAISAIPAADVVEVRHGRWEAVIGTRNSPKWGNNRVACSECRRSGYTRYSYCPNCGAKMDGKGEG